MIWKKEEHSLGYYIFSLAHGLYYMNDEKLKNLGITNQQGRLLEIIYDNKKEGKKISRKFCEEIMHLRGPSVTNLLNALESKGYITRTYRKEDQRFASLDVTEKGETLVTKIRKIFFDAESQLQKSLSPKEEEQLKELLKKIYQNLPDEIK